MLLADRCQLPSDSKVNGPASTVKSWTSVSFGGLCIGQPKLPLASPLRITVNARSELVLNILLTRLIEG